MQDTFRRRIVIYLLCLLRAFSRKQRANTAVLRISQLTGGRKGESGHPPDGGFAVTLKIQSENSVTERDGRPRERVEGLKATRIGLKRPISRARCKRGRVDVQQSVLN